MEKRNLSISSRREGTRDAGKIIPVVKYEIKEIKAHFDESVKVIKDQFDVADGLMKDNKDEQAAYIWRAQIVFLESAFDFFMHELTKYGLQQIFDDHWKATDKYRNIQVDMKTVAKAFREGKDSGWFLEYINSYYGNDTLVSFDSFKRQINLLGLDLQRIADEAFYNRESSEKTKDKLKRRLNQLFARRNLIAHQSDRKHEDASINTISREVVESFLEDTQLIVESVVKEVNDK